MNLKLPFIIFLVVLTLLYFPGCTKNNEYGTSIDTSGKVLEEIIIENLNDSKNSKIALPLPEGWHVSASYHKKAADFEFKADKNKSINVLPEFEIFDERKKDKLFYNGPDGLIGLLSIVSYYPDKPERQAFPNHSTIKRKVYDGQSILGKCKTYILDVDIPDMLKTKKHSTYEMVYSLIPIRNEELTYIFLINVPIGEKVDSYVKISEQILKQQ